MKDCVFCQIVKGVIPAFKIWEDNQFLAILDINPNTKGASLVLPKTHFGSHLSQIPDEVYQSFWLAAKKVGKLLEEKLKVARTALVVEGTGVDHAHIKVYPLHGSAEEIQESSKPIFYEKYPGFVDTRLGPKADFNQLKKLAREIKGD